MDFDPYNGVCTASFSRGCVRMQPQIDGFRFVQIWNSDGNYCYVNDGSFSGKYDFNPEHFAMINPEPYSLEYHVGNPITGLSIIPGIPGITTKPGTPEYNYPGVPPFFETIPPENETGGNPGEPGNPGTEVPGEPNVPPLAPVPLGDSLDFYGGILLGLLTIWFVPRITARLQKDGPAAGWNT